MKAICNQTTYVRDGAIGPSGPRHTRFRSTSVSGPSVAGGSWSLRCHFPALPHRNSNGRFTSISRHHNPMFVIRWARRGSLNADRSTLRNLRWFWSISVHINPKLGSLLRMPSLKTVTFDYRAPGGGVLAAIYLSQAAAWPSLLRRCLSLAVLDPSRHTATLRHRDDGDKC
jgi:hypothetical protein